MARSSFKNPGPKRCLADLVSSASTGETQLVEPVLQEVLELSSLGHDAWPRRLRSRGPGGEAGGRSSVAVVAPSLPDHRWRTESVKGRGKGRWSVELDDENSNRIVLEAVTGSSVAFVCRAETIPSIGGTNALFVVTLT